MDDFKKLTKAPIKDKWSEDKEFARQFTSGVNPTMITSTKAKR